MIKATVEHLPAEVLGNVFAFCIPDPLKDETGGRTTLEILEDVCDAWKAITSSTPELWTTISIKFHAGTRKPDIEQAFTSTQMFLQRSGILLLRISLIDRDRAPGLDCAPLIKLLVEHSERWRYVDFEMPMKSHRIIQHSRVQNRLSSLEELSLSLPVNSQPTYRQPIYPVYKIAPKLTSVHIKWGFFIIDESTLPLDQLVSWTGALHAGDFLRLLRICPQLRSYSVPSITRCSRLPLLAMMENNHLSQLTVELNDYSEHVLPYVTFPALRDLTVKDGTRGYNIPPFLSS